MKNSFTALLVLLLAACGTQSKTPSTTGGDNNPVDSTQPAARVTNSEKNSKGNDPKAIPSGTADTGVNSKPGTGSKNGNGTGNNPPVYIATNDATTSLTGPDGKAIVFVGVFATWKDTDGNPFDGSYDSTYSLFYLCDAHRYEHVPNNRVIYRKYGSCDTAYDARIMMLKVNRDGSINPNGTRIKVVGNEGFIKEGRNIMTIQLDPSTMTRIHKMNAVRTFGTSSLAPGFENQKESKPQTILHAQSSFLARDSNTTNKMKAVQKQSTKLETLTPVDKPAAHFQLKPLQRQIHAMITDTVKQKVKQQVKMVRPNNN